MSSYTAYFMEGSHRTKAHVGVRDADGNRRALCRTDSSYPQDYFEADLFPFIPEHRQCRKCMKALTPPARPLCGSLGDRP